MGEDILPVYRTLRDTKDFDVRLSTKGWTGVLSVSIFVLRGWVANIALAQRCSSGNSGFPSSGRQARRASVKDAEIKGRGWVVHILHVFRV